MDAYWWSPRRSLKRIVAGLRVPSLWYRNVLPPNVAFTNYGDELNAMVLPELVGRSVRWVPLGREEVVGIGTLLDLYLEQGGRGQILGSGAANASQPLDQVAAIAHRFLSVRGPLTRDALGLDPGTFLGDPGLIVRTFGTVPASSRRGTVFIPHMRDFATSYGRTVITTYRRAGWRIAVPTLETKAMIKVIGSAAFVATSGLHGLILSHALRTPAALVSVADDTPALPGRKYQDYVASVGLENRLHSWQEPLGPRFGYLVDRGAADIEAVGARVDSLVEDVYKAAAPLRSSH